ncbi:MAG: T9SS type A sorting domain-containing protein, partial [Bacteroidia bacterium]|nr:T9SS type A sorting domain-containing protein [Bacteroidia bacterium]
DRFAIILPTGSSREAFDIQLIDMMGRNIQNIEILGNGGKIEIGLPAGIHPGNYIVRFIPQDESSKILWKKLVVEP